MESRKSATRFWMIFLSHGSSLIAACVNHDAVCSQYFGIITKSSTCTTSSKKQQWKYWLSFSKSSNMHLQSEANYIFVAIWIFTGKSLSIGWILAVFGERNRLCCKSFCLSVLSLMAQTEQEQGKKTSKCSFISGFLVKGVPVIWLLVTGRQSDFRIRCSLFGIPSGERSCKGAAWWFWGLPCCIRSILICIHHICPVAQEKPQKKRNKCKTKHTPCLILFLCVESIRSQITFSLQLNHDRVQPEP